MTHIKPDELNDNLFKLIGKDWALLSAADKTHEKPCNTMTVSWGGTGVLWGKNVFFCFIRPQRYTKEFIDNSDIITLSFFDEAYRSALTLCGKQSGRDTDKIEQSKLTPIISSEGAVSFEQARLTITGKKLYETKITPEGFLEGGLIEKWYPDMDFHTMYVCEITDIAVQ